jgi:uncharacterized protein
MPAGVTVDISPVLLIPTHESEGTTLAHYTYTWPAEGDILASQIQTAPNSKAFLNDNVPKVTRQALALGLGSMFNHSRRPNIAWERDIPTQSIRYFTLREIEGGEELCISYGPKLWFNDIDGPIEDVATVDETDVFLCGVDVFD